ncbi:hypothetical protein [uncultured Muribaculum sp.]|uniref:hypothetical protein n=1 Tax=uncultured Muribaculum sp. TaxID=1918613 RepID=UPI0025915E21|nr:hypothetical protein [uncultured Muribaculum sp.]
MSTASTKQPHHNVGSTTCGDRNRPVATASTQQPHHNVGFAPCGDRVNAAE